MTPAEEVRQMLLTLRVIMLAIALAMIIYIGFGWALSNGMFPSLHLPFIVVQPAMLRSLYMLAILAGALLVAGAVYWEQRNMAPERLIRIKGKEQVRALLARVYVGQAMLIETIGIIGLMLLFAGLSFQNFLFFSAVPLMLLGFKIAHLEDLVPTLERLL